MDYLTPLQDFFETFTWDIESKYNSNEVTLIEKTLFFIKEEFDATLTEFYVIKTMDDNKTNGKNKTVDKNKEINKNRIKFLKGLNLHIERLKNLINTSNIDYIEIDSQLMEMHHIILEQYQKLRGIVWAEKHSKVVLSSNARKGGRFSSSIYA